MRERVLLVEQKNEGNLGKGKSNNVRGRDSQWERSRGAECEGAKLLGDIVDEIGEFGGVV